ncbi:MAG: hypothetical protein RMY29_018515 [Nostoc sp. CreGUA01]
MTIAIYMLLAKLALSTTPDVEIEVYNDTDEFQNIVIFQPEDELNLMFEKNHLFPIAWQVFPLPGKKKEVQRYGTTVYTYSQEVGVTHNLKKSNLIAEDDLSFSNAHSLNNLNVQGVPEKSIKQIGSRKKNPQKIIENLINIPQIQKQNQSFKTTLINITQSKLVIKIEALNRDKFKYWIDDQGGQHINKLDDKNDDGSISCENNSPSLVTMDLYRNNAKLATWQDLPNGDQAKFKIKNILYFMYSDSIKQGQIIEQSLINNNHQIEKYDVTGYSQIEVRLIYDTAAGGKKKKWVINAR